ncbi:MAG: dihydroxy-acid dehydratase [Proteobacteria bacterium]|nr:dihydroxy-acid dehydratase [Pseudomonadota bacterium]
MELRSKQRFSELNGLMYACGFTEAELGRPMVGVVNAFSEVVPGHMNLRLLTDMVKAGIHMAGGVPIEFPCIAMCDGVATGRYQMASRNHIADSIEITIESHMLDGMVLLSGCDKIVPGQLMALARLNLPAIMVTSGPMQPGCRNGRNFALSDYVDNRMAELLGKVRFAPREKRELMEQAFPTIGSCQGMYTANSMAIFAEALGLTLPGSATIHAVDTRKMTQAKMSGMRVVEMIQEDLRPSSILTGEAFENAIRVGISTGASTNLCAHVPAIAREAGLEVTIDDFDRLSRETPHLSEMCPAGEHAMLDLDRAGGVAAVMKELASLLHLDVTTVTGRTMAQEIAEAEVRDREVIRPLNDPIRPEGGMVVLRGSLAPEGAIARSASFPPGGLVFEGRARCFSDADLAAWAVLAGEVKDGDIVVARYEGLKGGPGAREVALLPYMLNALGADRIGMITDGRLSGSNRGALVCHVTPEAYEGGPLALVEDGDRILIDIPGRRLDLLVSGEELEKRRRAWKRPEHSDLLSFMRRFVRNVGTLHQGALEE